MKEMKFRAWDDVEDKMYYIGEETDIIFYFDDNGIVAEKILGDYEMEKLPYLKYMQFTGLYDRKGTPIYEGDLLQHPNGVIAEIKCSDYLAAFVAVYVQNGDIEINFLDKRIVNECEIVGNIYENPELLEVEREMNEFCPTCNGSGGIEVLDGSIGEVVTIPCPDCGESGETTDVARKTAERAKHYEQSLERMQREIHKVAYE